MSSTDYPNPGQPNPRQCSVPDPSPAAVQSPSPETTADWLDSTGAPGALDALARGCACSVLANAGYRTGADLEPLIDPSCPVHHHDSTSTRAP